MSQNIYKIVSIYSFFSFKEKLILELKDKLLSIENDNDLSGLLIIAKEGINGTISSDDSSQLSQAISFIKSIKGFKDLDLKFSQSAKKPFIRLKVKLKKEIVTIGDTKINPNELAGEDVDPKDWN